MGFSIETTIDNAQHGLVEDQVNPSNLQVFGAYAQIVRSSVDVTPYGDKDEVLALGALQIFGDSAVDAIYGCGAPDYRFSIGGLRFRIDSTNQNGYFAVGKRIATA